MKKTLLSALALALCLSFATAAVAADGINVNTASKEELAKVPGLNADLAAAIIKYREEMGDFNSLEELSDVPGMTDDILNKAKDGLQVEGVAGAECNC